MKEKPPKVGEQNELIPTIQEVRELFKQLLTIKHQETFETVVRAEDKDGLYLWRITVTTEVGHDEYEYMRKGNYAKTENHGNLGTDQTHINFASFAGDDFITYPETKAKLASGKWNKLD